MHDDGDHGPGWGPATPWTGTLRLLYDLLHDHDPPTARHGLRVGRLAAALAARLGLAGGELDAVAVGGAFHDLGKLAVPAAVLRRPGPLTEAEWALMHRHPALGACLLAAVGLPPAVVAAVHHHHERFDGTGYPARLAAHAIPLPARIVAVADAFDVMTVDRPYRAALAPTEAVAEISRHRGTQFDPEVVDTFVATWPDLLAPRAPYGPGTVDRGARDGTW